MVTSMLSATHNESRCGMLSDHATLRIVIHVNYSWRSC